MVNKILLTFVCVCAGLLLLTYMYEQQSDVEAKVKAQAKLKPKRVIQQSRQLKSNRVSGSAKAIGSAKASGSAEAIGPAKLKAQAEVSDQQKRVIQSKRVIQPMQVIQPKAQADVSVTAKREVLPTVPKVDGSQSVRNSKLVMLPKADFGNTPAGSPPDPNSKLAKLQKLDWSNNGNPKRQKYVNDSMPKKGKEQPKEQAELPATGRKGSTYVAKNKRTMGTKAKVPITPRLPKCGTESHPISDRTWYIFRFERGCPQYCGTPSTGSDQKLKCRHNGWTLIRPTGGKNIFGNAATRRKTDITSSDGVHLSEEYAKEVCGCDGKK
eukprot:742718_1